MQAPNESAATLQNQALTLAPNYKCVVMSTANSRRHRISSFKMLLCIANHHNSFRASDNYPTESIESVE